MNVGNVHGNKRRYVKGILLCGSLLAWFLAEKVFDYHSAYFLPTLLILAFVWLVLPEIVPWIKRLSLEAVEEALAVSRQESATIPSNLNKLRADIERLDFAPYEVIIRINHQNLTKLFQKAGFVDEEKWINGAKWSNAELGHELGQGIVFTVLSVDRHGNPQLVNRVDGGTPIFMVGLGELDRAIEEVSFEYGFALFSKTSTWHPSLCFGELLCGSDNRDTYQIAINVHTDWWDKLSTKPEFEYHKEYAATEHGPVTSGYLVFARIPKWVIHGKDLELSTVQSLEKDEAQLKELGWTSTEHENGLQHDYCEIYRYELERRSVVGKHSEGLF